MGILKPKSTPPSSPFRVQDLEVEASRLVEEARRKADAIVRAAKEEAARVVEAAEGARRAEIARGFAEGRLEGIEKGRAEGRLAALAQAQAALAPGAAAVKPLLEKLGPALEDATRRASEDAQAGVIRLALAIARAVTKREVSLDDGVLRANVAAAVALAARRDGLELRVHPLDVPLVDQYAPELSAQLEGLVIARVVPDESVGRGGVRVTWPEGNVGAGIEEQLAQIGKMLLGEEPAR